LSGNENQPVSPPAVGSNNWAVHPDKSASGAALLANDPHLPTNLPSWWLEMQLTGPGVNVYGVTLPGAPGIIIGFNEHIAWGVTNAGRDVKDWFKLDFQTPEKQKYRYEKEWRPVKMVVDTYLFRGGEVFLDTVKYTALGPVVYDETFRPEHGLRDMALRWTAHEPSLEAETFYRLNRAQNYTDYRQALQYYHCPGQNFVFASTQGNIAIQQQGRFPLLWPGQGRFILEAADERHHWEGDIPQAHNPHTLNPERGFISSANQHPTDASYPYYYQGGFGLFRSLRINEVLPSDSSLTIKDMKALQGDNKSVKAALAVPLLLDYLTPQQLDSLGQEYHRILEGWDYFYEPESKAPPLFETWWHFFYRSFWQEIIDHSYSMPLPGSYRTIQFLKTPGQHPFLKNSEKTAGQQVQEQVSRAFQQMQDSVMHWKEQTGQELSWWRYKNLTFSHLGRIEPFGEEGLKIGGNRGIVNAAGNEHAPSWRMVVHLTDTIEAYGIYAGGQSGNPGSPYYTQYLDEWEAHNYRRLLFMYDPNQFAEQMMQEQTFQPE
jgi:penicillin amidase